MIIFLEDMGYGNSIININPSIIYKNDSNILNTRTDIIYILYFCKTVIKDYN